MREFYPQLALWATNIVARFAGLVRGALSFFRHPAIPNDASTRPPGSQAHIASKPAQLAGLEVACRPRLRAKYQYTGIPARITIIPSPEFV